ncbi:TadG family pilus assembly protein [Pseudomonas sp. GCM10022186]|uniref:TadG family pilus assembly protein n=1 Tax=Pseudomonas sp. GCM10022186 TaxID=3252650 RepID=UPI003611C2BA
MRDLRRQRGAIGLMATLVLLFSLMMLALTVDAGRLYFEKRKLQRVADMAAMESAASSGLCGTQVPAEVRALAQASAVRHGYGGDLGAAGNSVDLGYVELDGAGERRLFQASASRPEAVRVQATRQVPASLVLGGLWGQRLTLQAVAVAQRPALAGFSLGSGLASIDTQQSAVLNAVLGGLLGTSLDLDAASYQGLANARLNLLQLNQNLPPAAQLDLSAGNVQALLDARLTVDQLLDATAGAANARETLAVGVRNGLDSLADVAVGATQVELADILQVETPAGGGQQALSTDLSALDLVTALAFLANKSHAVDVDLGLSLGGLSDLGLKLHVIEPPQIAIGLPGRDANGDWRTQVSTAQVRLEVGGKVTVLLAEVDLALHLEVAQGWAALQGIDCGSILPGDRQVSILAQPGIASLGLGRYDDIEAASPTPQPIGVKILPPISSSNLVSISGAASIAPGQQTAVDFSVTPGQPLPQQRRVSSPSAGSLDQGLSTLGNSLNVSLLNNCALCSLLGPTLGALKPALIPLISLLGQEVLEPVLKLLGIDLGYADVRLMDLDASSPRLML